MQSRASPGFTRSSSSTWLERMIPSHPLISNWQSEESQGKHGEWRSREKKRKGKKAIGSHGEKKRLERSPGGRSKEWQHRERWGILFLEVHEARRIKQSMATLSRTYYFILLCYIICYYVILYMLQCYYHLIIITVLIIIYHNSIVSDFLFHFLQLIPFYYIVYYCIA